MFYAALGGRSLNVIGFMEILFKIFSLEFKFFEFVMKRSKEFNFDGV